MHAGGPHTKADDKRARPHNNRDRFACVAPRAAGAVVAHGGITGAAQPKALTRKIMSKMAASAYADCSSSY